MVPKTSRAGPVILYELNEVPWRVIDWYVRERPRSALESLLRRAQSFTSVTRDEGELQPWVTWPTLHRSVYNRVHRVRYINQDLSCAREYLPIWEKLARAGKRVGVFGSLQSYPPPRDVPYAFYVPDTFAPGPETVPVCYSAFQRLNLRQTRADRAFAKPIDVDGSMAGDVIGLFASGLRVKTAARLAAQLLNERLAAVYRTRRPIFQAPVAFDMFRHALTGTQPDFCTFFTNHVAGIMHRYWKYAFPEDFDYELSGAQDEFHRDSLLLALDDADDEIRFLKDYVDARDGRLYIASSMGQQAVHRQHEVELVIEDVQRFARAIGFSKPLTPLAAMHPDYSFELGSASDARELARAVTALRRADGTPAFYGVDIQGKTMSCSAGSGEGFAPVDGAAPSLTRMQDGVRLPFAAAGLTLMERDAGTGYHQPEGILIRYGAGVTPNIKRMRLETVEIAPMIMRDLGVDAAVRSSVLRIERRARIADHALA